MNTRMKNLGLALLGATAVLGTASSAARAQSNFYDPYGTARTAAYNIALYGAAMRQVPPYALGYNPYPAVANRIYAGPYAGAPAVAAATLANNAYAGSPGYGYNSFTSDPYAYGAYTPGYGFSNVYDYGAGFLRGSADVISSEGKFRVMNQQANLIREQVRQARIENRRRAFEEWQWERANTPTLPEERERINKIYLQAALANPSLPEIFSGVTLNTILDQLKQMQARGVRGPSIPLDEDMLKQINVTTGANGSVGLLKKEGRLTWPLALSGSEFETERKNLERNLEAAIGEVSKHGQVDRARMRDMLNDVDQLLVRLGEQGRDLNESRYVEAKRYINQLSDAMRALLSPDAEAYINGKYVARGKTVGELIKNMGGLQFASAVSGEEKAYRELYQALSAYYNGAQQAAGTQPAPTTNPKE